jgi:hypothetical protein
VEVEQHRAVADEPEVGGDVESELKGGWYQEGRVDEAVYGRGGENYAEMGWEEVGFEEAVVEGEEVGLVDWFRWWVWEFGGRVGEEGFVEPSAGVEGGPIGAVRLY